MSRSWSLLVMDVRSVSFKNSKKSRPVWRRADNVLLTIIVISLIQTQQIQFPRRGCVAQKHTGCFRRCEVKPLYGWSLCMPGRSTRAVSLGPLRCWAEVRCGDGVAPRNKTGAPAHLVISQKRNLTGRNTRSQARKQKEKEHRRHDKDNSGQIIKSSHPE